MSEHYCPECDYSGDTGHAVACHYGHSHDGKLSDKYPDIDTSLRQTTRQKISEIRKQEAINGNHPMQQKEIAKKQSATLKRKANNNELPCQEKWNRERQSHLAQKLNADSNNDFGGLNDTIKERIQNKSWGLQNDKLLTKAMDKRRSHNDHYLPKFDIYVDSLWEKQFAHLLHEHNHEFTHEPCFKLESQRYYPDFKVNKVVFELKGYIWSNGIQKANQFLETYPSYTYVVIGKEMPADHHYLWQNKEDALELL